MELGKTMSNDEQNSIKSLMLRGIMPSASQVIGLLVKLEHLTAQLEAPKVNAMTADEIIEKLEAKGLGWSLDHTGNMIEASVWDWPEVIGRYRPRKVEPLADMLMGAIKAGEIEL